MIDYMSPESKKKIKQQERILQAIQYKSKEVHSMVNCHEKAVEEDILDFLTQFQCLMAKEL